MAAISPRSWGVDSVPRRRRLALAAISRSGAAKVRSVPLSMRTSNATRDNAFDNAFGGGSIPGTVSGDDTAAIRAEIESVTVPGQSVTVPLTSGASPPTSVMSASMS
jgi:hypothetical protein